MAIGNLLNALNDIYVQTSPHAVQRPIKGYLQLVKIAIYIIAAVLIIASLVGKSPLVLLTGLGAMTAVLMLVFKDTILSLVASVQLSRSEEHTSELQSLMRISYAVFCLKKKTQI